MAKQPAIPDDIRAEVETKVEIFNKQNKTHYQVLFKGRFCYLSRMDNRSAEASVLQWAARLFGMGGMFTPNAGPVETKIGRLAYTGEMKRWEFAPYRYSSEKYDTSQEMLFFMPGSMQVDGTIEGAMRAGLELYP